MLDNKVRQHLPALAVPLFDAWATGSLREREDKCTSELFLNLSTDAPVSSFFPYVLLDYMKNIVNYHRDGDTSMVLQYIKECHQISTHISHFLYPFLSGPNIDFALSMIQCLIDFMLSIETVPAEPPTPIALSYNPPRTGTAYYFTRTGEKLREARYFAIDKENAKDNPVSWTCSKNYPAISSKGNTVLFLFFCPLHGHCFGFHIVDGSEGRKDAACALYTHLEHSPEIVFYDFACQLEEYCLNRESGFFSSTRFYHDAFHGYGHKCPSAYSSASMTGKKKYNESICEQFNSFLQNIKQSAKHMNQTNFIFHVQFMIDIWNERKADLVKNKKKIATLLSEE